VVCRIPARNSQQSRPCPFHLQGDIDEAARSLAALPDLQEVGLYDNQLSGSLDESGPLCRLAQVRAAGAGAGAGAGGRCSLLRSWTEEQCGLCG